MVPQLQAEWASLDFESRCGDVGVAAFPERWLRGCGGDLLSVGGHPLGQQQLASCNQWIQVIPKLWLNSRLKVIRLPEIDFPSSVLQLPRLMASAISHEIGLGFRLGDQYVFRFPRKLKLNVLTLIPSRRSRS
jgi:hypothetical protein